MNIKQAIYTLLDKAKHRFRGAIGEGTVNLGEIDSITPTKDGWLVITAQPNAGITIPAIIRVSNRTNTVYEYTGTMYSGGIMNRWQNNGKTRNGRSLCRSRHNVLARITVRGCAA